MKLEEEEERQAKKKGPIFGDAAAANQVFMNMNNSNNRKEISGSEMRSSPLGLQKISELG